MTLVGTLVFEIQGVTVVQEKILMETTKLRIIVINANFEHLYQIEAKRIMYKV